DDLCSHRAASPLQRPFASRADVIVVGGGPAGSSSAWHLSRLGLRVLLVDKARFPRPKACAEYLSPEANRIMGGLGALEPVLAAGAAGLRGMRIRSPDGTWLHGAFATTGSSDGPDRGAAIRRHLLDTILLERAALAGATIRQGLRVTGLVRDANGRVHGV